jgi:PKD repeat protein
MNTNTNQFEELFNKAFDDFKVTPSSSLWTMIRLKFLIRNFFNFSLTSFNIYYLSLIILGGSIISYYSLKSSSKENLPVNEIEAANNEIKNEKISYDTKDSSNNSNTKIINKNDIPTNVSSDKIINNNLHANNQIKKNIDSNQYQNDIRNDKNINYSIISFTSSVKNGCAPLLVKFKYNQISNTSLKWDYGDGYSDEGEEVSHIYKEPGTYIVSLKTKLMDDKYYIAYDTIKVLESPVAQFKIDDYNSDNKNRQVAFINLSINNVSNEWDFGDGQKSDLVNPIHTYKFYGEFMVTLMVKSENGCSDTFIVKNDFLKSINYVRFPNAFAPNTTIKRGGIYPKDKPDNELFYPIYEGVRYYSLKIFNRAGLLVFSTNDINVAWDGWYNNQPVEEGVYVWEVKGEFNDGQSYNKHGTVTVIIKK